jgi:hypothetical protein
MSDKITTIAIVTCNRLPGLIRALESYIANVKKYGREVEFAVFDDTRDPQGRENTRAELRQLKQKHTVTIRYAGKEEKVAFAAALEKESGVDRKTIEFALFDPFEFGNSVGANRNAVLLQTAGEMIYSADDDTVCEFYTLSNYRPDIAISSMPNPTELHLFKDKKAADLSAFRAEKNLLEMAEDLLGHEAAECVSRSKLPPDLKQARPEWSRDIMSGHRRVRLSWVGIFGDSGFKYPSFLLWLFGESRKRLLKDAPTYAAIKLNRQILRAPVKRTLGPGPFCQTTALGLDNRQLLPPFMPVLRGEDILFGTTLRHCFLESCFGYLPWAIRHEPMNLRANEADDIFVPASSLSLYTLLSAFMRKLKVNPTDTDVDRLIQFGKDIASIARQPASDFDRMVSDEARVHTGLLIEGLDRMLEDYKAMPDYWAKDILRYKALLEQASRRDDFQIPGEVREKPEPLKVCADLIQNLGDLFEAWPRLINSARALKLHQPLAPELR